MISLFSSGDWVVGKAEKNDSLIIFEIKLKKKKIEVEL